MALVICSCWRNDRALFASDAAPNPTAGSHSRSLIQVKMHSRRRDAQAAKPSALRAANGFAFVPIGVAWAHGIGGCRTDLPEQSSHGPARVKYTPRTTVLEATPASYLSMARERIEFGDMAPTRAADEARRNLQARFVFMTTPCLF